MNYETEAIAAAIALGRSGRWTVMRHGGRSNNAWREYSSYPNESWGKFQAERAFEHVKNKMRQGGLAVISPDDKILRMYCAPLARSNLA